MEVDRAFDLIEGAVERGKTANAYLFSGRLNGDAMRLANKVLGLFFKSHVEDRANPDIHWLFPEKKSRMISVEAVRDKLIAPVSQTAFAGGWKAGVIVGAECFNNYSANAFLKTLEEPPENTLFLLLCEAPEKLLPTIVSRCQRIDLNDISHRGLDIDYAREVSRILAEASGSWVARAGAAGKLALVLAALKNRAKDEVVAEANKTSSGPGEEIDEDELNARISGVYRAYRLDMMITITEYFRRVMGRAAVESPPPVPLAAAFRNLEQIEEAAIRMDARNMTEASVLGQLMDVLQFPKPQPGM